jgi:tRNA 5-methylaminomethyl-2-thiouridine biosynthesis bifunctional protein
LTQLHAVFGSISSGPAKDLPVLPALPVQGQGHFLPTVPSPQGLQWLAGAGFEANDSASEADCHQANLARIAQFLPDVSPALQAQDLSEPNLTESLKPAAKQKLIQRIVGY